MGKRLRKRETKNPMLIENGFDVDTEGVRKKTRCYPLEGESTTRSESSAAVIKEEDSLLGSLYDLSPSELMSVIGELPSSAVVTTDRRDAGADAFSLASAGMKVGMMVGSEVAQVLKVAVDDDGRYTLHLSTSVGDYVVSADRLTVAPGGAPTDGANDAETRGKSDGSPDRASSDGGGDGATHDVDRFVICSYGQMECRLCDFGTADYSTFKSHIICSHPRWRITKKLSKNRLLVEQSARAGAAPPLDDGAGRIPSRPLAAPKSAANAPSVAGDVSPSAGVTCVADKHASSRKSGERHYRCRRCRLPFVCAQSAGKHVIAAHDASPSLASDDVEVSTDDGATFAPYGGDGGGGRVRRSGVTVVVYRCQICGYTADSGEDVETHAARIHHQQLMMFGLTD